MKKFKHIKKLKKVKGVFSEFKAFILRGNVVDLAIGVIVGGAFQKIITALVNNIIMPVISLATPKNLDIADLFIALDGQKYATLAEAKALGAPVLTYGSFLMMVLDFVLMALVIFVLIKSINAISKVSKKEGNGFVILPPTKKCPYCKSSISPEATRCPHCTSHLIDEE
jgi:large conductance mechanosensitive channel